MTITANEIYSLYFRNFVTKNEIMIFSHDGLDELVCFNSNKMHHRDCQDGEIISLNFVLLDKDNKPYILNRDGLTLTYFALDPNFHNWKLKRLYLKIEDVGDSINFLRDDTTISGYRIELL